MLLLHVWIKKNFGMQAENSTISIEPWASTRTVIHKRIGLIVVETYSRGVLIICICDCSTPPKANIRIKPLWSIIARGKPSEPQETGCGKIVLWRVTESAEHAFSNLKSAKSLTASSAINWGL